MFDAEDANILIRRINRFAVPMFVADRRDGTEWHLQCINDAYTRACGFTNNAISGTTPHDLLSKDEADLVTQRYSSCIQRGDVIQYAEMLHINSKRTAWQTTLQPIKMADGRDRIIGTALQVDPKELTSSACDAAYFAAMVQMQIGKVQGFLNSLEERPDLPLDAREKAMMVAGLVRSLDHVLWEMRQAIPAPSGPMLATRTTEALTA